MLEITQIQGLLPRFNFLWQKSLGIWLSVWAIRYKADWDYKLSDTAKAVRWGVVGIGYVLTASLPGPGIVRVMPGATGLCFLCWPNLAYHLTNFFVEWPTTEGKVLSVSQSNSYWLVSYSFELRGEAFGGITKLKAGAGTNQYSAGQRVTVGYDPLNPSQSTVVSKLRIPTA